MMGSCRQPPNHFQNPVIHLLQIGDNLVQWPRRREHIKVPVQGNLVALLGLDVVNPGIRMEEDLH